MFPIPVNVGNSSTTSPNLVLNFASGTLDPRVTYTRAQAVANTVTFTGSNGLIQYATANQPRFDYNPTTLACNGLLIEEARTNLLTYSADLTNANWTKSGATVTGNSTTSPDGASTGNLITVSATTSAVYETSATYTANTILTFSSYFKQGTARYGYLCLSLGGQRYGILVDLNAGTLVSEQNTATPLSNKAYSITNAGNGWYRLTITGSSGTSGSWIALHECSNTSTPTFSATIDITNATVGANYYAWGAQLEAGAFPTSLIQTTTTSITRNADNASMTGTNFSSWFNASQGTFVASTVSAATNGNRAFSVSAGPNPRLIDIYTASGPTRYVEYTGVTSTQYDTGATSLTAKVASTYSSAGMLNAGNGVAGGSNATNATTVAAQAVKMEIGCWNGSGQLNGWAVFIKYYPTALTLAQIKGLTT